MLLTLVLQLLFELAIEFGWTSIAQAFKRNSTGKYPLACFGWFLIGAGLGALSAIVVSQRVIPWKGPPGASLIIPPILCGILMKQIGDRRREQGKATTALSSFWGGSLFAFGFALLRFLLV